MDREPTRLTPLPPRWQDMIDSKDPETKLRGFIERGRATEAWAARLDAEREERHRAEYAETQKAVSIAESELAVVRQRHAEEDAARLASVTAFDRILDWLFSGRRR